MSLKTKGKHIIRTLLSSIEEGMKCQHYLAKVPPLQVAEGYYIVIYMSQICHISLSLNAIVSLAVYWILSLAPPGISTCSFPIGPSENLPQSRYHSSHRISIIPASPHQGTVLYFHSPQICEFFLSKLGPKSEDPGYRWWFVLLGLFPFFNSYWNYMEELRFNQFRHDIWIFCTWIW